MVLALLKMLKNLKKLGGLYFSYLVLAVFTIIFLVNGNYEFLTYTVTIGVLIFVLIKMDRIFSFAQMAKWGFATWLFLHLMGGSLHIGSGRLYDTILINLVGAPLHIFRYDQFMHFFCYFVFALFVYSVVKSYLKNKVNKWVLFFIVVLIGEGIGGINEIIEFGTVVFLHSTGVGDYYNNALDLVFNFIGAIFGTWIAIKTDRL